MEKLKRQLSGSLGKDLDSPCRGEIYKIKMENTIDSLSSRLLQLKELVNEKMAEKNVQIAAEKDKEMLIIKGRLKDVKDDMKRSKTN